MMKCTIAVLSILVCLLLAGCITTEPGKGSLTFDAVQNTYTHAQSGFSFPPKIGNFQRGNDIQFYDKAGANFSVPYNLVTAEEKAAGHVYIYPSLRDYSITPIPNPTFGQTPEWFLKQQYDSAKTAIIDRYKARVLTETEVRMNRSSLNPTGEKGVFEYDTIGGEAVLSQLYLFSHKGWLVKYRFSYPSKYNALVEPEIGRFIELFQWP